MVHEITKIFVQFWSIVWEKKYERNRHNDMNFKDESMLSQLHICLGCNATSDKEVIECHCGYHENLPTVAYHSNMVCHQ